MTTSLFYALKAKGYDAVEQAIDLLSHADRITLREALVRGGCRELPRNLYYDYDKQVWILNGNGELS